MWIKIDIINKQTIGSPVSGIKPDGFYLPVVDNSIYPTDPDLFKATPSYEYAVNVEAWLDEAEIKADWSFSDDDYVEQIATQGIKSLEQCKVIVYKILKDQRDIKLFGSVTVGEVTIIIEKQRDVDVVTNLGVIPVEFKKDTGDRIDIGIDDGLEFKVAYLTKVNDAFKWEKVEEEKVTAMDYEQLVIYLNSM